MQEEWWESPVCWLCDYWWVLLIVLVLALTAYFTKDEWLPLVIPPTPTPIPAPTNTPRPTVTRTLVPSATPTQPPTATLTPTPTATFVLGTGDVQITLLWSGMNDLDLHVIDPQGQEISFAATISQTGGQLDIDSNRDCNQNMTNDPVENIYWPEGEAPVGTYAVFVHYFKTCAAEVVTPFSVRVLVDGQEQEFTLTATEEDAIYSILEFNR